MITKFRVQNYKALRDVSLKLSPIHVVIGPNDSGKTSLLEALGAFCRSVDSELVTAFRGHWEGRDLVWCRNDEPIVFTARFNADLAYQLGCDFKPTGREVSVAREPDFNVVKEIVSVKDKTTTLSGGERGLSSLAANRLRGKPLLSDGGGTYVRDDARDLEKNQTIAAILSIPDECAGVHVFRWVPGMLSLPSALDPSRTFRMDESGFGLATCLDDIIGHDIDLFRKLETRLVSLFPDIRAMRLKTVSGFSSSGEGQAAASLKPAAAKGIFFDTRAVNDLPASKMSDGVLLVLAYLTLLHLPNPPRLLLIEEPENGIHPQRLQDVIAILKELVAQQSHTQIVMTTHSPYLLDMFSPSEVSLCRKEADGSATVHSLSESELVRKQLDVFTLGEIWTAEGDEAMIGAAELAS